MYIIATKFTLSIMWKMWVKIEPINDTERKQMEIKHRNKKKYIWERGVGKSSPNETFFCPLWKQEVSMLISDCRYG